MKTLVLFFVTALVSSAGAFEQIQSRWKSNQYINVEKGLTSGPIKPGWHSAQWTIEKVSGTEFVKLKNRWKSNQYLHNQNGRLEFGRIKPGWWSAQWKLIPTGGFYKIQNRWKPAQFIHIEKGKIQVGTIQPGWHSAQWKLTNLGNTASTPKKVYKSEQAYRLAKIRAANKKMANAKKPVAKANPTKGPFKRSSLPDNKLANFEPQKGGKLYKAFVRYDDQIQVLGARNVLRQGQKIFFFEQRLATTNRDGIKFNPEEPEIGGQTFTIKKVSPKIVLDRHMPNMRNRVNSSFSFIVEIY